jgi:lipopolysaccharide/colanic/teichoic acid biosynthesis glycosyltransferase
MARLPSTLDLKTAPRYDLSWLERYHPERAWFRGRTYHRCKRGLDLLLCLLAAPILLPLLLLIALLIKLDSPGAPVLFAQERTGKHGRRFRLYKFRTMVPNAEELKRQLAHLNELQWPDFKITNDPRITRVGRFLRRTSLDELPQLLNVVKGDMSLVGPRPTSFAASTYQLWQTERLDVTPGLTGLWQIYGRAQTEFTERLRLDIAYIERRCLALDLELLVRTALAVLQGRGAH